MLLIELGQRVPGFDYRLEYTWIVHYGGEQSEPTWRRTHCAWHIPRRGSDDVQLGRGGSKSSHSPILLESRPAWFWAKYRDVFPDARRTRTCQTASQFFPAAFRFIAMAY